MLVKLNICSTEIWHKILNYNVNYNDKGFTICRQSSVIAREASCCTKGPRFESPERHGCQTVRFWPYQLLSGSSLKNW